MDKYQLLILKILTNVVGALSFLLLMGVKTPRYLSLKDTDIIDMSTVLQNTLGEIKTYIEDKLTT